MISEELTTDGQLINHKFESPSGRFRVNVQPSGAMFLHKDNDTIGVIFEEDLEVLRDAAGFAAVLAKKFLNH